jgi:hypothetical protein
VDKTNWGVIFTKKKKKKIKFKFEWGTPNQENLDPRKLLKNPGNPGFPKKFSSLPIELGHFGKIRTPKLPVLRDCHFYQNSGV